MSLHLILLVELFFILYYIPGNMTRLARASNRSAPLWSLLGVGAWLAGEFIVVFAFGAIYGLGVFLWGWSEQFSAGFLLFVYVTALAGAGVSLILVERNLDARSGVKSYPLPPPPRF